LEEILAASSSRIHGEPFDQVSSKDTKITLSDQTLHRQNHVVQVVRRIIDRSARIDESVPWSMRA